VRADQSTQQNQVQTPPQNKSQPIVSTPHQDKQDESEEGTTFCFCFKRR